MRRSFDLVAAVFLVRSGSRPWLPVALWGLVACVSLSAASRIALQPGYLLDLHEVRNWLRFWAAEGQNPYPHFGSELDYPPMAFLVLWPLALPSDATVAFWFLPIAIGITACAGWEMVRWIGDRMYVELSRAERLTLVALLLSTGGVRTSLYLGQTVALSMLFGVLAMRWKRRRPLAAAVALALCSFKLHVAAGFGLAILLMGGVEILLLAGAIVVSMSLLFSATVGTPLLDIGTTYAVNLLSLYEGDDRVSGFLSLRVVFDHLMEYPTRTIVYVFSAVTMLAVIVVLSRRRRADAVTQVEIMVACLLWSLLFLPHQLFNMMLATPALWLLMWPETGVVQRRSWRAVIVAAYVLFGVINVPQVFRLLALWRNEFSWMFDVSYFLSPLRLALIFVILLLALFRRAPVIETKALPSVPRSLFADPFVIAPLTIWAIIVAFYVVPGVPPAVLTQLGDTYSTLPLWPWAIAACLTRLSRLEPPRVRRTLRLLAASFACLVISEVAWAAAMKGMWLNLAIEWLYLGYYAFLGLAAVERIDGVASRARWRLAILTPCVAAAITLTWLAVFDRPLYRHGVPSSIAYLTLDASAALLFLYASMTTGERRWRAACRGLALASVLFFVTDLVDLLHNRGIWNFDSGSPWDLMWTLPVLVYVVTIRAKRYSSGGISPALQVA